MRIFVLLILTSVVVCTAGHPALVRAQVPECTGDVTLGVSFEPEPTFDWEPECAVAYLLVESVDADPGADVWSIESKNVNEIVPPIQFGLAPDGTSERWGQRPVPGTTYRVVLYRRYGPTNEDWALAGTAEFILPESVETRTGSWTALKSRF